MLFHFFIFSNAWRYEKLTIAGDFLSSYTKSWSGLQAL